MTFEVSRGRTPGGVALDHAAGASVHAAHEDAAAASTYPSHGANHRPPSPALSATSNSSGFYTKNTFNSHQSKKTIFERVKHQAKVLYLAQLLFGFLWIICSLVLLKPPVHCLSSACLTILQASFAMWARSWWIEKEQTLARKRVITRACLLLSLVITILECLHFIAAVSRVPLYTAIELTGGYLRRGYRHTDLQIAFTYVFALGGAVLSALNVFITHKLVQVCQDLHSNVHIVLGYDQQIGYIFQPINIGHDAGTDSSIEEDESSSAQGGEGGQRVASSRSGQSFADAEEMFFKVEKDNDSLIYVDDSFNARAASNCHGGGQEPGLRSTGTQGRHQSGRGTGSPRRLT